MPVLFLVSEAGSVLDVLTQIYDFISGIVFALAQAFLLIQSGLTFLITLTGFLPSVFATGVMLFLAAFIIKFLVR